jgi:hypothetical protein
VKEFWTYTLMRALVFAASLLLVLGVWSLVAGGTVHFFWALLIAFLISGAASLLLLDGQREALARRVQTRADRASAKLEEMRTSEDDDAPSDESREQSSGT